MKPSGERASRNDLDYVYICQNNTIFGTMFTELPLTGTTPLVADVSSCFLSLPLKKVERYGLDLRRGAKERRARGRHGGDRARQPHRERPRARRICPTYLGYQLQAAKGSMYNTPNTFGIYLCGKVFRWVEQTGGLTAMEARNRAKAELLYDLIDRSEMFHGTAQPGSRSIANVTFRTGDASTDTAFIAFARERGIEGVKGHRLVGGMRASIYNAVSMESVEALATCMRDFEASWSPRSISGPWRPDPPARAVGPASGSPARAKSPLISSARGKLAAALTAREDGTGRQSPSAREPLTLNMRAERSRRMMKSAASIARKEEPRGPSVLRRTVRAPDLIIHPKREARTIMRYIKTIDDITKDGAVDFGAGYEFVERAEDADAILMRSTDLHGYDLPEGIRAIGRCGAGVNNIPIEEYARRGVVVFNSPGANSNAVKEIVLAMIIMSSRGIVQAMQWVRANADDPDILTSAEKAKKAFVGHEVRGKRIGVVGLGNVGSKVANACVELGMDVYGYDPFISVEHAWALNREVQRVGTLEDLCRGCDYLTLHVPSKADTVGMI